jgi:uncharacterized protein YdcH (DUF465 family)
MSSSEGKSERSKLYTNLILLVIFAAVGAIMGYVAFEGLFNRSESVGIVGIGSFDPGMNNITENFKRTPIEPVKLLMKRIQSRAFLSAVANNLDDPSATYAMQEAQYGGSGDMSANTIRDELALEISVKGMDDKQALARTDAVMQLIINQHREIQESIEAREKTIRDAYQADINELRRQQAKIDEKLSNIQQATSDVAVFSFLLAEKKQLIDQEYNVKDRLYKSESLTTEPYFVATKIIAGPFIRRTTFLSPLRSGLLGAFAGLAFGFALIHMRKMIV